MGNHNVLTSHTQIYKNHCVLRPASQPSSGRGDVSASRAVDSHRLSARTSRAAPDAMASLRMLIRYSLL